MKMLNSTGTSIERRGIPLVICPQMDFVLVTTVLRDWLFSQFSIHLTVRLPNLYTVALRGCYRRQYQKTYGEVKVNHILALPSSTSLVASLWKAQRLSKHDFHFINPTWFLLIIFLSSCSEPVSRKIFSIIFPDSERTLTDTCSSPDILSHPFWSKGGHLFSCSSETMFFSHYVPVLQSLWPLEDNWQ